jgi:hypothetical protein
MDPSAPADLARFFRAYDAIRSHEGRQGAARRAEPDEPEPPPWSLPPLETFLELPRRDAPPKQDLPKRETKYAVLTE